jgi:adenosylcobinamide-GDP ribazoletransferase
VKEYFRGFITAVHLLTIVPITGKESEQQSSALYWFPVLGCLIGGLQYGIVYVFTHFSIDWSEGVALIVLGVGAVITGGLHLDGLADWADSLGCVRDREKMLRIMKDSRIGTFGVIAIVIIFCAKWSAINRLIAYDKAVSIVCAAILSRTMMVDLAVRCPYARTDGGTGRDIITTAGRRHLITAYIFCVCLVFLFSQTEGIICLMSSIVVTYVFSAWTNRILGGITGDILGACSELVETTVLLIAAFFVGS